MYTLGLTGGIGSGKTLISNYLRLCGAHVLDTDIISHQLTQPGEKLTEHIQKKFIINFGLNVCNQDGSLNRALLRNYVFNNKQALTELENLIYPEIHKQIIKNMKWKIGPYLVLVVPLLIEKQFLIEKINRILLVDCSKKTQISRVTHRSQLTKKQIEKIIASQATREERLKYADDVIINEDKDKKTLFKEVQKYHRTYLGFAKCKNL